MLNLVKDELTLSSDSSLLINKNAHLIIKEDTNASVSLLVNSNEDVNITIDVKDYARLSLTIVSLGNIKKYNVTINVFESAYLDVCEANVAEGDIELNQTTNLVGRYAEVKSYEYISTKGNTNVKGIHLVNHKNSDTVSNTKCVYLTRDESSIVRNITSAIPEKMINSVSSETIKGVILGEKSKIIAEPILIIGCEDVHAAHGCAIGTLDDNEIYYLMSRGLSKSDAIKMITSSFIVPVLKHSKDEEYNNTIMSYLEKTIEVA